ncbi:Uncharacterized protein AC510_3511 [Pseudomonas amygdali pv. myricae]|uniref:hypothetical protein n=1 Tax=Pseudomonas amygdali TaxID=47877 RepID=UPI0006B9C4EC|nr:hypothetical protein [Pseudomonas amygdali]KPB64280.1 Uncharacterized protein AC510_3511 [Pseudomonas amygdali pv. myricae]
MTDNPNDVRSPCELLPCPYCGRAARYVAEDYVDNSGEPWPFAECDACNTGAPVEFWNKRAQPADQHGEPFAFISTVTLAVAKDIREYQYGVGRIGARLDRNERHCIPLYLHAQPAKAKMDEQAEFDNWVMDNSMQGVSMFDVWQARAKLNTPQ